MPASSVLEPLHPSRTANVLRTSRPNWRAVQTARALLPPQHLPQRHCVPVHSERGRGLAAIHHRQANPDGHPGADAPFQCCCRVWRHRLLDVWAGSRRPPPLHRGAETPNTASTPAAAHPARLATGKSNSHPTPPPHPFIQDLLDNPNPMSPAQSDAFVMYQQVPACIGDCMLLLCSVQLCAGRHAAPSCTELHWLPAPPKSVHQCVLPSYAASRLVMPQRREEYKKRVRQEAAKYPPPV